MTDLTADATRATSRARLVEQVLLDRVQERAIAELRATDPKAEPPAAVVWVKDGPPGGALIAGGVYTGRAGELHLVAAAAAAVLKDAGYVETREQLTLPAWQRPEVAAELRETAAELREAADRLDPSTQPPAPTPEPAQRQDV